jgi:ankyrin repeat protein
VTLEQDELPLLVVAASDGYLGVGLVESLRVSVMTDNAAVFLMVEAGDVAGVRTWLSQRGDPNIPRATNGSLLHYGAMCGHVELIRLLLDHGTVVDNFDSQGDTPLFTAVRYGHPEVARLLLNRGARLAYTFQLPDTATERARVAEERDRIRAFMNGVDMQSRLRAQLEQMPQEIRGLMERTQAEVIDNMWSNKFEPEEKNVIDYCEHFPTVKMLLSEFGADINRINPCGRSPLIRFAASNDILAVKWLLENGALVDQTSTGETALFSAIRTDSLEMIKLLIDAGANVNQYDCDQCVPLHCTQSIESAALLLDRGANPTLRDQASFPCWHFVRNPDVQRYLVAAAAVWEGSP